jgi:hypothetical protein
MTLPPVERMYLVSAASGPKYKVGPRCSMPTCSRIAEHAHHIFRRSAIGGDHAWVDVDGYVVGNLTGLCVKCHNQVTGRIGGHEAAIRFNVDTKVFHWAWVETTEANEVEYVLAAAIDPQPPTPETLSERTAGQEVQTESENCPTCGQMRRRQAPTPPGERRRRKSWNVSVPDDTEDGAELLDAYVDDVAQLLGAHDWADRNKRYWSLMHALAWVMQKREEFASDAKEAA